ncbi:GntR family transcriptional regulator [Hoeflea poritis]|uniref:GntR family transcriptional regulator n=1 Tax=Hoeflea poritis TaxID=2993659 RepID=A0ABT4VNT6_9HYPH|nr:GntR family transcriptional regulator [Hoeflea poritis]MDA4845693.1 GntR family transcriptional regulator [Hoeflea poritis]
MDMPDKKDGRPAAADLQDIILERICFLQYQPGDQLREADLAAEFGTSRTPVRDALSRISHLGLIESRNGVGTVVITLSDRQIAQVYEMRLQLAPLIGTVSPTEVQDTHIERADALLDEARQLAERFDEKRYVVINHRLNQLITDLIGNAVLQSFWRQTYYQAASTWYQVAEKVGPEVARSLVDELDDLCTALRHGDLAAVGHIQRVHIGYGYARIKTHLFQ